MAAVPADTLALSLGLRQMRCVARDLAGRRPKAPVASALAAQAEALAADADRAGLLRFHRPAPAGLDHATLAAIAARRTRQAQLARRAAQAGAGRDGLGHH